MYIVHVHSTRYEYIVVLPCAVYSYDVPLYCDSTMFSGTIEYAHAHAHTLHAYIGALVCT